MGDDKMNIGKNVKKIWRAKQKYDCRSYFGGFCYSCLFFYQLSNKFDARADKYCCLC